MRLNILPRRRRRGRPDRVGTALGAPRGVPSQAQETEARTDPGTEAGFVREGDAPRAPPPETFPPQAAARVWEAVGAPR